MQDILIPLGLTVTDAAHIMGITRKALSEFVNEKTACSSQMAMRIAIVTSTSAESWLVMQAKFDLWKTRQNNHFKLQKFPKVAV